MEIRPKAQWRPMKSSLKVRFLKFEEINHLEGEDREFVILAGLTSSRNSTLVSYLINEQQTLLLPVEKSAGRYPSKIVNFGASLLYSDQDGYIRRVKYD